MDDIEERLNGFVPLLKGYVLCDSRHLSVCLTDRKQNNSKNYEQILCNFQKMLTMGQEHDLPEPGGTFCPKIYRQLF